MAAVMLTLLLKIKYLDQSFIIVMVLSEPWPFRHDAVSADEHLFYIFVGTQIVCQKNYKVKQSTHI